MRQRDGSVLPSFLRMNASDSSESWAESSSNDLSVHVGTVIAVYAPQDENNYSKNVYEYDVEAQTSKGQGLSTSVTYPRCRLATTFGGLADKCIWTPRVQVKNKDGSIKEPGTQVVIECINGISRQGFIVACLEPEGAPEQSEDFKDSPRLQWQFNGVDVIINKDGELTLTRLGPTNAEGKPVDENDAKVGASLILDKDGKITVKTGDDKNVLTFDLDNGKITILADKGVDINVTNGKLVTSASNGVELGGTEKLVKGDTYVGEESKFIQALSTFINQMTAIAATLSGASMEPAVIAAAPQLNAACIAFAPQIQAFKAQLDGKFVLSTKNSTE